MPDNIKPIHIHPRTGDMMREANAIDYPSENERLAYADAYQGGMECPVCGSYEPHNAHDMSERWAWEQIGAQPRRLGASKKTPNGTARMRAEITRMYPTQAGGPSVAMVTLDAWEQRFDVPINFVVESDLYREAECWADQILAKDPRPKGHYHEALMQYESEMVRLEEFLRATPGTGEPEDDWTAVEWAIEYMKAMLREASQLRQVSNGNLHQVDYWKQRAGLDQNENRDLRNRIRKAKKALKKGS